MCTAVYVVSENHYFGRNLDYEITFGEKICITPRNFTFDFTNGEKLTNHYAIIGVAVNEKIPLYFDGVNEKGLCMAGLSFPHDACYSKTVQGKDNVASFEMIPYILSKCSNVESARRILRNINITDTAFSEEMPPTPLHWIIADKGECIVFEQTKDGVKIFDNPIGVLTNSPSFDIQFFNLNNYLHLSTQEPNNTFSDKISLTPYSRGMGALGLPGDNSSMSRFVRASFVKLNSEFSGEENDKVNQFFHILYSVNQQRGCVNINGKNEITNYSVCANAEKGIYYFTTYDNFTVHSVAMRKENLDASKPVYYELYNEDKFIFVN